MSPSPMIAEAAVLILKLSLWCALPFLLRPLLARSSASTRHLLLTLTLAGAVALPLLRVAAPAWQAPAWLRLPELAPARDVAVEPATPDLRSTERMVGRAHPGVSTVEPGHRAFANPTLEPVGAARAPGPERPPASTPGRQSGLHWLVWLWLAGIAAAVFRTARVVLRTRRVVRQAAPLDEPRAMAAMSRARAQLHIAGEPELRQSRRFPVPFAWRGLRPVVVLPPSWRRWSDERLTVVLIHELAHLSRRDASALWIGRAATALWWFHPLVRRLEGWARRECERAADDAVLLSGSRASAYAEHLIAISRALARPFPAGVALMMSNSPDLKHRLLAILRPDQPRRALTRRLAAGASLLALAFAVVLAGARFAPAAYAQEPEPAETQIDVHHHHHGGHHDDHSDSDSGAGRDEWEKASGAHRAGRYEEAVAAFEAAAAAGFRPAVAIYNAACGLSLSGRSDEALAALRRAVDLGLDDPELLAEDSDLDPLRSDARFQSLVDEAFERAGERRDPIEHHRYRNAQEALQVLRESASEDAGAWSKVGTRLLMLRQLDAAAEALENAARFARESPATALYNLACAYALDGRPGDALGALERSIEAGYSDPEHMLEDPDLRSLRGDPEFERLVDLADALDLGRFERAFWHGGGEDEHGKWKHKGKHGHGSDSRYSAERWAPAVDFYRGFVDQHPSLGAGWFNFAMALHYSERFDESVDAFRRAGELGFRPATSTYNAACGLSMQNRVDEALAALEEAIELGFHGGGLEDDSDLDNLRSDPRFRSLLLEMKLDRHG